MLLVDIDFKSLRNFVGLSALFRGGEICTENRKR